MLSKYTKVSNEGFQNALNPFPSHILHIEPAAWDSNRIYQLVFFCVCLSKKLLKEFSVTLFSVIINCVVSEAGIGLLQSHFSYIWPTTATTQGDIYASKCITGNLWPIQYWCGIKPTKTNQLSHLCIIHYYKTHNIPKTWNSLVIQYPLKTVLISLSFLSDVNQTA